MTAWASMLVPVGGVIVGAAIAGGTAIGGQIVTHRGNSQREREARRDAFKLAQFETERETLLSLQEEVLKHVLHLVKATHPTSEKQRVEAKSALMLSRFQLTTLAHRCLAREAADAVTKLANVCGHLAENNDQSGAFAVEFHRAQELLGAALRRDPFEADR